MSARQKTKGTDLLELFDYVNDTYLGGIVCGGIAFRNLKIEVDGFIQHGVTDPAERFIRINKFMDDPDVPDWALEFLVFHEMLHLLVPPDKNGEYHTSRFNVLEKRHPYYKKYLEWSNGPLHDIVEKWSKPTKSKKGLL